MDKGRNKKRLNYIKKELKFLPVAKKGRIYPPIWYNIAPKKGPNSKPIPEEDSIRPIIFSLSSLYYEAIMAKEAVEFKPLPKPQMNFQMNEKTMKLVLSSTYFKDPNPRIETI